MKIKRNELCPCGSGRKFKKCCGSAALDVAKIESESSNIMTTDIRDCGDCTACCEGWLTTHVLGQDIYLQHPCKHSDGHGCQIHAERPQEPCKTFFCGWAQVGSDLPVWMQPNVCGVIVLKNRMSWHKMPVDILVSTHQDPDEKIIQWFENRCRKLKQGFIYQLNNQWFAYGPQQFQLELAAKINRGEALWDGSLIS